MKTSFILSIFFIFSHFASASTPSHYAWVELGDSATVIARVITQDSICPSLQIDGKFSPMNTRATPVSDRYENRVCELVLPAKIKSVKLGNETLPLPLDSPKKILVIGDTGCRIKIDLKKKTEVIQDCNNPDEWPFARIAKIASVWKPDLIIHVGDYLYREHPCPEGNSVCKGSPWGDRWATWDADFFSPALPLLKNAPWIFVRGNHEDCKRANEGWRRYLSTFSDEKCKDAEALKLVKRGDFSAVVLDSTLENVNEATLQSITALHPNHAWLLTHRPIWTPESDPKAISILKGIDLVLAGHLHQFRMLRYSDHRATEIIAGNSGSKLDEKVPSWPAGTKVGSMTLQDEKEKKSFGYLTLERKAQKRWLGREFDSKGNKVTQEELVFH